MKKIIEWYKKSNRYKHAATGGIILAVFLLVGVVVREFSGEKSMREAFEQLIERQTCEHFEEWLEQREMAENAA